MLHFLRNGKVLALAALLIIGTTVAVGHNRALAAGRPFAPEDAVRVAIKPLQATVSGVGSLFEVLARSMRSRRAIRRENVELRAEVKRLNLEVAQLRENAAETKRLRAALGFKKQFPDKLIAARVISRNPSEWFTTATIDRGRTSGIVPGQAIVTYRGFVGQVFESSPTSAQIRVLTDGRNGVGSMVQRSRAAGICQGQDTESLHFTYLAKDADIKIGDIVVTSGQGGIVPKGLPVGRVLKVQMESGGFMKSATVRPSVRFDEVEEVFVVLRKVN